MKRYFLLLSVLITLFTAAASAQDSVSVKSENNRKVHFGVRAGVTRNSMFFETGTTKDYTVHHPINMGWHAGGVVHFSEQEFFNGAIIGVLETGLNFADRKYDSKPLYYLEVPLLCVFTLNEYRFLFGFYGGVRLSDSNFDNLKRVNFGLAFGFQFRFYKHFIFGTYANYNAINLDNTNVSDKRTALYSPTISLGWDF